MRFVVQAVVKQMILERSNSISNVTVHGSKYHVHREYRLYRMYYVHVISYRTPGMSDKT